MKIYIVMANGPEHGEAYAFASKREAVSKRSELRKHADYEMVYDSIFEQDFPISKAGILAAYEAGSEDVPK